jgi:methylated-DNA-protein-cysteine methyltransferase related protein
MGSRTAKAVKPVKAVKPAKAESKAKVAATATVTASSAQPSAAIKPAEAALTQFQRRCLEVVRSSRPGDVMTYGDVAHDAGNAAAPRAVGALLARSLADVPWWRVVYGDGRIPPCSPQEQIQLLGQEGVTVTNHRVRHRRFGRADRSVPPTPA